VQASGTAASLVLLAFAPAVTILTYELRGYQAATHANQATLGRFDYRL